MSWYYSDWTWVVDLITVATLAALVVVAVAGVVAQLGAHRAEAGDRMATTHGLRLTRPTGPPARRHGRAA